MASALLVGAASCSALGMAWLALAKRVHWTQVCGGPPLERSSIHRLRVVGAAAQVLSLVLCLLADHGSMAALVWLMTSSASALGIAFILAYRPGWLRALVGWIRPESSRPTLNTP
jgi:hypothetical protein